MFNKVLWATDGSDSADKALVYTKTLATESSGEVLVVHVVEYTLPGKGGGSLPRFANEDELQAKVRGQVRELSDSGLNARLEVAETKVGGAAHVIADAAKDWGADLIVVGTRGHTQLGGLLVGSVTQRLLHISSCPVLSVPAREEQDG